MKMRTSSDLAVDAIVIPFPSPRQRTRGPTAEIRWTGPMDTAIKRMRSESASWDDIGKELGVSRWCASERGRVIGARLPDPALALD